MVEWGQDQWPGPWSGYGRFWCPEDSPSDVGNIFIRNPRWIQNPGGSPRALFDQTALATVPPDPSLVWISGHSTSAGGGVWVADILEMQGPSHRGDGPIQLSNLPNVGIQERLELHHPRLSDPTKLQGYFL